MEERMTVDSGRPTADVTWGELQRRLAERFEKLEPLCAYEPHVLAESVVGVVRDWLMEQAQLRLPLGPEAMQGQPVPGGRGYNGSNEWQDCED